MFLTPFFLKGTMGDGYAVEPNSSTIVAPISGTVAILQDTLHAFLIKSPAGAEVLVHVGIDTVELNGKGFTAHVAVGDQVEAGQPVVEVDWASIEAEIPSKEVMVMVTNSRKFGITKSNDAEHPVTAGDAVAETFAS